MSELTNITALTEQQLATATSLCMPMLEGISNAFRMQADYLQRLEILTAELLQRRRAGCAAMQRVVERLGAAHDTSDVLQAQQEWFTGATQRIMADATCWQTAGLAFLKEMSLPPIPVAAAATRAMPETPPRRPAKVAA